MRSARLLYQRWLLPLARNFVTFDDLDDPEATPLFQRGTLVLSGRQFPLPLGVDELQAHRSVATRAGLFIVYARVEGDEGAPSIIACPVFSGGSRGLQVVEHHPLRFIGVEVEGGVAPSRLGDGAPVLPFLASGQVVGQLGLWSVTPSWSSARA